ncbi:MAG TPA: choice-of-anchor tandem repeat GloVer-containing protein, partial [Candidatus Tumulicola sp.]|nr:choice-of-anchor tandem repeat GloVer-containing protein [Candidatus Tumulicola sp.]
SDGSGPRATLVNVNGTFFGTTYGGGANCSSSGGCGTVFAISPSGAESVVHSFGAGSDGVHPAAGLVDVNGTLYGTTVYGGANGDGTVFAIPRFGPLTVLYSFAGGSDGASPRAGLLNVNGTLYGTTSAGGASCGTNFGCGTVFSITTSGTETVLHGFGGTSAADGANPYAGLVRLNGKLYGTTLFGGANNAGTVFSLTP